MPKIFQKNSVPHLFTPRHSLDLLVNNTAVWVANASYKLHMLEPITAVKTQLQTNTKCNKRGQTTVCNVPRQCVGPKLHAPPSTARRLVRAVKVSTVLHRISVSSLLLPQGPCFAQQSVKTFISKAPPPRMVLAQALNVRGKETAGQVDPP